MSVNPENITTFTADNENIKDSENFTYLWSFHLGVNIQKSGDRSNEIMRRITIAKTTFVKLDNIWKSHELTLKTK